jgi:hypothetical protein
VKRVPENGLTNREEVNSMPPHNYWHPELEQQLVSFYW